MMQKLTQFRSLVSSFFSRLSPGKRFISDHTFIERIAFVALFFGIIILLLFAVNSFAARFTSLVPVHGGHYVEGVVGFPERIHPVFAETGSERSAAALVYAGLMRISPDSASGEKSGQKIIPELAKEVSISEDGTVYTITIREDAFFHDGAPVTAEDVVYTITQIQDPDNESPSRAQFENVAVAAIDNKTVTFTLEKAYAPFIENLTVGIVPAHIWRGIEPGSIEFIENMNAPVGAGPFTFSDIELDNTLGVMRTLELESFGGYVLGEPLIEHVTLQFFSDREKRRRALESGAIDAAFDVSSGVAVSNQFRSEHIPTKRVFSLFFNQGASTALRDTAVRDAMRTAIDSEKLAEVSLLGYARSIQGPLPFSQETDQKDTARDESLRIEKARRILEEAGWILGTEGVREKDGVKLSFTLHTAEDEGLTRASGKIKQELEEIGIEVTVIAVDVNTLVEKIVRPRNFETILFGYSLSHVSDLYPFWHSGERLDPGLNISGFAHSDVDDLLLEAQSTPLDAEYQETVKEAAALIKEHAPAVFLFSPDARYVVKKHIYTENIPTIVHSSDRFAGIHAWSAVRERRWNFLLDPLYTIHN